jgi:hypothetical protein
MSVVSALANFTFHRNVGGGDTGKGGVEHRSFKSCCSLNFLQMGQIQAWADISHRKNIDTGNRSIAIRLRNSLR